ncbi:16S rRNA (uracil(1498)-N(3))-methyltransferase [Aquimarina sp. AD10]|uniref:Ribosomal RNA small subunit methyltransferase E n=1 Tax=Aquimarina aggregata TaxID=1642818 RepID=A0A162CTJ1_9FLAO|nr:MULTISPECIES: 16S rRNA (uracil(1498)-N(3))-methyltransferase [Aquimarina]AXT60057.1 16S rRNA (uracil(1498)-N(3))-methyltransferase [Aquimarina sp. AD10]KZS41954.1 16S rRNA methyltransferase [Aquimarina aggregata]RKM96199.1 16S rRNA (uracil(1498)-N(3))-methyltransferase [Aquimarina sp. AD10]
MQLFYNDTLTETSTSIKFSREESKHISKVLRKQEGDTLNITNGKGLLFTASITFSNPSQCHATIDSYTLEARKPYRLHLVVAPTKMNDRYEWFLEKATEIGIHEITPIICDHSERKVIKQERFERILLSAMKQSLQCYLPKLNPAISFSNFISTTNHDQLYIAHCEETKKQSLKDVLKQGSSYTILIGPEGDFSTKEIELALTSGYTPVTLGDTRLRTETAAMVATHSVAFINS